MGTLPARCGLVTFTVYPNVSSGRAVIASSPLTSFSIFRLGSVDVQGRTVTADRLGRVLRLSQRGGLEGVTPYPALAVFVRVTPATFLRQVAHAGLCR